MTIGRLSAAFVTDVGLRRRNNQDAALAEDGVVLVCDGMGGGVAGERASASAVERMRALASLDSRRRADIERALVAAQHEVLALGRSLGGVAGTTVSGVVLAGGEVTTREGRVLSAEHLAYVLNVGDSRTYHMDPMPDGSGWDAGSLIRITRDHSQRQEMIDSGELLPDMARELVPRNVITQCVGAPEGIAPDLFLADATGRFIVCSDGLHAELGDDERIARVAAACDDPREAAHALVRAALEAGGSDNVTVAVADMPVAFPARHAWSVTKLDDGEDIGNIADGTLETLRTIHQGGHDGRL